MPLSTPAASRRPRRRAASAGVSQRRPRPGTRAGRRPQRGAAAPPRRPRQACPPRRPSRTASRSREERDARRPRTSHQRLDAPASRASPRGDAALAPRVQLARDGGIAVTRARTRRAAARAPCARCPRLGLDQHQHGRPGRVSEAGRPGGDALLAAAQSSTSSTRMRSRGLNSDPPWNRPRAPPRRCSHRRGYTRAGGSGTGPPSAARSRRVGRLERLARPLRGRGSPATRRDRASRAPISSARPPPAPRRRVAGGRGFACPLRRGALPAFDRAGEDFVGELLAMASLRPSSSVLATCPGTF